MWKGSGSNWWAGGWESGNLGHALSIFLNLISFLLLVEVSFIYGQAILSIQREVLQIEHICVTTTEIKRALLDP